MKNIELKIKEDKQIDIDTIKFYLNDEHFNLLYDYLNEEDYAMAKDAVKGLYILALDLQLYRLYESLVEIYEDLEDELYNDALSNYKIMYQEYKKARVEYGI